MGKISIGGCDYGEGPSDSTRKRLRISDPNDQQRGSEIENSSGTEEEQQEDNDDRGNGHESEHEHAADDRVSYFEDGELHQAVSRSRSNGIGGENFWSATDDRDKSIPVFVTDLDVFDCRICYEPLSAPVFQCNNGHVACSNCCARIGNKCPMCSMPIGYTRCRAFEKVLESIKMACPNAKYGCKEIFSYCKKNDHEKECIYLPCSCPHSGCDFVASSKELSLHFSHRHVDSGLQFMYDRFFCVCFNIEEKAIVLHEKNGANLFILHNKYHLLGNMVNLSCIGPNSIPGFQYDILARSRGNTLILQSFTKNIQRGYADAPSTGFILIPSGFFGSGQLKVDIRIRVNTARPADLHRS